MKKLPGHFDLRDQRRSLEVRYFWSKVKKTKTCWLWTGARDSDQGYGSITWNRHGVRVHRFVWMLTKGAIPDKLFVLHKCDVRCCVRPSHLFLGTHTDNMQDAYVKMRYERGEAHSFSKLSERQVIKMRKIYALGLLSLSELSRAFEVDKRVISKTVRGESWAHAAGPITRHVWNGNKPKSVHPRQLRTAIR